MAGWELLLGAALEAVLGVLAAAGFGDEAGALKERLTGRGAKARQAAFDRAFRQAAGTIDEASLSLLLAHLPFQEAVVAGLLDPLQGFDVAALAATWQSRLPTVQPLTLRRFFSALENALLADETWGPILERYQNLRFRQDVTAALQARKLDVPSQRLVAAVNSHLTGSGAMAQDSSVAAGAGGMAVGGDVLGDVVQTIIQQLVVERVEVTVPRSGPQPDALRTAYLRRLVQECGALRLLGLDTSAGHAGADQETDVRLEAVYVHLDTDRTAVDKEIGEQKGRHSEREVVERRRALTALEAVGRFRRLVLTGGPGAGKSTLASYLTLCLAARGLPAETSPFALTPARHLPGWPDDLWPLPLRVILRDFARSLPADVRRGTADRLWQHVESNLSPLSECRDVLKEALMSGEALVILDGLDEVPEVSAEHKVSPRQVVLQAVEDFALRAFPDARYLVTCRTASYVSPWTLPQFEVAPLAEFDQKKRDLFCRLWYVELKRRGQLETRNVAGKVSSLQQAIRRPDLARMAGNPLLLTVMALVHAQESELPEARALLYEKCVAVLLWLWERRKEKGECPADLLTLLQEAGVDRTFFVRALDRLAYQVHKDGGAQKGEADVRASVLERRLEALHPQRDPAWARRVATFMRERAGLLVERRADEEDAVLAFPHRTFQEYLAACWLTEGEDTARVAAELAREGDHWWEVVKLAAGRLLYVERKVAQPLALLDWLCPAAEPDDEAGWQLAHLAGEVLLELKPEQMLRDEAARSQVASRLDRIRCRLVALLAGGYLEPRERAAAGNTLAQLGDPRFRAEAWYLPAEPLLGFVEVPAGSFLMGTPEKEITALLEKLGGERDWYKREAPQHKVDLPGYYVSRYPVTQAQYWAFVQATGHKAPAAEVDGERPYEWQGGRPAPHLLNHPVVLVTWHDAEAYCRWLTEVLREWEGTPEPLARLLREEGWVVRLPREAEWEKAARGRDGRLYPWGNEADPNRANYGDTGIGGTSAVGCFPGGASPYGCLDMSGNVLEWTADWYQAYPGSTYRSNDFGERYRVVRGGSWFNLRGSRAAPIASGSPPDFCNFNVGFRVLASLASSEY